MKQSVSIVLASLLLAAAAAPAAGQDVVNVRISAEPVGARYTVDGQSYLAPMTFLWPTGSKHVVSVLTSNFAGEQGAACHGAEPSQQVQYDPLCSTRYSFSGWSSNISSLPSGGLLTQTVTVDPSLTWLKATFTVAHLVQIGLVDGPTGGPSADCAKKATYPVESRKTGEGVGIAFVNGACFDYSGSVWMPAGPVTLQAIPFEGFAFAGWNLNGNHVSGSVASYTVKGPATLAPRFVTAKRVQIVTEPAGLRVRVDRTEILTVNLAQWLNTFPIPGRYDWLPGSKHVLGGVSPQVDRAETGKIWVFQGWSNGGGQDMVFTADTEVARLDTLTAKFVPGVQVNLMTEPRGLRLNIEGRENWPVYSFSWGLGFTYKIAAPAEQTDGSGRRWTFKGWKHGGPAAQEITIDDKAIASGGVYYTAVYESVPQLVLQSSVPGMQIKVDGVDCAAPCRIDKPQGSQLHVSVPTTIAMNEVSRYEFQGWHDGAGAERVITIDRDTAAFQANYRRAHRVITIVDPEEGGAIAADPGAADGYYGEGTAVSLRAEPKPGFKFRRWDGDLSGTVSSGVVDVSGPRVVRAWLDRVPHLPTASVRNAAGPTPVDGVAPGSLISIAGASLTTAFEAGPASPLAQTLGGVVVLVGDRILPLVFVSSDQINALLPSDLEPGLRKLTVRPQSGPEVSTEFNVVRNAPGLFLNMVEERGYAVVLREDGSAVTPENRAKRGEVLTLLGTGFGPYSRPVVDGFAVPAAPQYDLQDGVDVTVAGSLVRPLWSGAQPGATGLVGVRFRLPAEAGGDAEIRVTVNGAQSNTALLPVE